MAHGLRSCMLFAAGLIACATTALAQDASAFFPSGSAGYEQELGVTVATRLHPDYEPLGVHAGGFMIYPSADAATFYNSNVNGSPDSGSLGLHSSATVSAFSNWRRNNLDGVFGLDNYQFFSLPSEHYTDWNIGGAAGYTIDDGALTLAIHHTSYHQLGLGIATVQSELPVADQTDSTRLEYTFTFNRLAITPSFSFSSYRYGTASVAGTPVDLGILNRNVFAPGVTGRYSLSDEGSLVFVLQGFLSRFPNQEIGQPSNNSDSLAVLGGFDYQSKGVWRYQMLFGMEIRSFAAPEFPTHTAPIVQGSLTWQPTGLTTVTASLSRLIEDPQSAGTSGYVLTQGTMAVDHELERNIVLHANTGISYVQYLQGSSQVNVSFGAGVQWLINRNIHLSFDVHYTRQLGTNSLAQPGNLASLTSGSYNQTMVLVGLHFAL